MREGFNIKSKLEIQFDDMNELSSVISVLTPDNVCFPKGLKLNIQSKDKFLAIEIFCENGTGTFLNTIDELLEHIILSMTVASND